MAFLLSFCNHTNKRGSKNGNKARVALSHLVSCLSEMRAHSVRGHGLPNEKLIKRDDRAQGCVLIPETRQTLQQHKENANEITDSFCCTPCFLIGEMMEEEWFRSNAVRSVTRKRSKMKWRASSNNKSPSSTRDISTPSTLNTHAERHVQEYVCRICISFTDQDICIMTCTWMLTCA